MSAVSFGSGLDSLPACRCPWCPSQILVAVGCANPWGWMPCLQHLQLLGLNPCALGSLSPVVIPLPFLGTGSPVGVGAQGLAPCSCLGSPFPNEHSRRCFSLGRCSFRFPGNRAHFHLPPLRDKSWLLTQGGETMTDFSSFNWS